ncbi:MAG: tRNA 4-thiouridine(8) synthase ThiI [Candidatus Aenigmarchaeota archaeon]|nr:tRNA 4-thiouridine(8) synthase ThiI [Candidatus Aenigmarchaeota archaeon]
MYDTILIKYAEISLKGDNRGYFSKKLAENIKQMFKRGKIKFRQVKRHRNHIAIDVAIETKEKEEEIRSVLERVFGIANFAFAYTCDKDIEKIKKLVLAKVNLKKSKSFKVDASRQDKSFPINSMEIGRIIGEVLYNKFKTKGDMKNPETTVYIDIADRVYLYTEKIHGLGNLPLGSSGKVLCLLSGGIDSPVAAWLMMKRGCRIVFVHFYNSKNTKKIINLIKLLNNYQLNSRVYLIPFNEFHVRAAGVFQNLEMILFRRYMLKTAHEIANLEKCKAIVLGDNLGQVASQTLDNILILDHDAALPVFRPLITYSKQEIIDIGQKIGTYKTSIEPYKDCCSIVSRYPATSPDLEKVMEQEKKLNMPLLIKKTMKRLEIKDIK